MDTAHEVFVPGRLCILGEHTDWAGGYRNVNPSVAIGRTIVCCTNEGLYASCHRYEPHRCHYGTDKYASPFDISLDTAALTTVASEGSFYCYVAGTLLCLLNHDTFGPLLRANGLYINNYRTTLPMKKGLSSSAAICVLIVKCFAAANQIDISIEEVMSLAYHGEMKTPSRCGRMDQCVALGAGGLALMEFTGNTHQPCTITQLFTPCSIYLVVADLNAGKDTVSILRTLNNCYPQPSNDTQLVSSACAAISAGDVKRLADAMRSAQSLFDTYICPEHLTSPRLHAVMQDTSLVALAVKGVGSQGDGSVQLLCASPQDQLNVIHQLKSKYGYSSFALTLPAQHDSVAIADYA